MNRPQTKVIILTLTNTCNLSCLYCYEHNKEARCMKYYTAEETIMREMTAEDGSDLCVYIILEANLLQQLSRHFLILLLE